MLMLNMPCCQTLIQSLNPITQTEPVQGYIEHAVIKALTLFAWTWMWDVQRVSEVTYRNLLLVPQSERTVKENALEYTHNYSPGSSCNLPGINTWKHVRLWAETRLIKLKHLSRSVVVFISRCSLSCFSKETWDWKRQPPPGVVGLGRCPRWKQYNCILSWRHL